MLVSSRRNLFYLCFLTDCTGIGFYARCNTGWFGSYLTVIPDMVCHWDYFCFSLTAVVTSIGLYSSVLTGSFGSHFPFIPVVCFFGSRFSGGEFFPTVRTIGIPGVALFFAGGFFYIADFRMLVSSRRNLFCLCFLADRAGVGLYARCGTGRFCCDRPYAPNMFMGIVPFSIKGHAIYRSTDCQGFYSLFILWFSIPSGKATSLFCHVLRKRQVSNRTI